MTNEAGARAEDEGPEDEGALTEVVDTTETQDADTADSGESGASADAEPVDELAAARQSAEENLNKYLRLAADMENLRKRTVGKKCRVPDDPIPNLTRACCFNLAA